MENSVASNTKNPGGGSFLYLEWQRIGHVVRGDSAGELVGQWVRHKKDADPEARWIVLSVLPKTYAEVLRQMRERAIMAAAGLEIADDISPYKVCVKKYLNQRKTTKMFLDMLVLA